MAMKLFCEKIIRWIILTYEVIAWFAEEIILCGSEKKYLTMSIMLARFEQPPFDIPQHGITSASAVRQDRLKICLTSMRIILS